jgi:hypothetical protein
VHLTDGTTLRWICPTRSVFECGFVSGSVNLIRFAYDGTAIICVGGGFASHESAGSTGAEPDLLALVVLGWFLLLDAGWIIDDHAGGLGGVPASADLPDGSAAHGGLRAGVLTG